MALAVAQLHIVGQICHPLWFDCRRLDPGHGSLILATLFAQADDVTEYAGGRKIAALQ
jgi:hypothetical protein